MYFKGNPGCPTIFSQIRVFFDLCLHQQLRFDNSLYIVHVKRFVLITEFPVGRHIAVPEHQSFIAIVCIKSRDWHYNAHTSHFKMAACRKFSDQNKLLGVNYIQRIIKFELLIQTQVEENDYSRLMLLKSRGSL